LLVNAGHVQSLPLNLNAIPRDFFDPTPEQQNVVLIDAATVQKAQHMIAACEACSQDAEIPFDNILDRLTGSDPERDGVRPESIG
jgi:hypothetical protein